MAPMATILRCRFKPTLIKPWLGIYRGGETYLLELPEARQAKDDGVLELGTVEVVDPQVDQPSPMEKAALLLEFAAPVVVDEVAPLPPETPDPPPGADA